jgi:hypothetical protein
MGESCSRVKDMRDKGKKLFVKQPEEASWKIYACVWVGGGGGEGRVLKRKACKLSVKTCAEFNWFRADLSTKVLRTLQRNLRGIS